MKHFNYVLLGFVLFFGANSVSYAARCAVNSSLYGITQASALSPHQIGISVGRKDGMDPNITGVSVSQPIVSSIQFEIVDDGAVVTTTTTKKGGSATSTSGAVLHKMQYGVDLIATSGLYLQRYFSRNQADGSGLNYDHHDFKESKILESPQLAGKVIRLRMLETYNCGKTIVASESVISMPSSMASASSTQIMAESSLQLFFTSAIESNNWTMTTYPGSYVKSNLGIHHAELYINGALYDVASYGQNLSGESMKLGDGSSFHLLAASKGAPYVFKRYSNSSLLPPSPGQALIRVVDLGGNISERVINY